LKTITTLLATAALIGGISVASAQRTPSQQKMDEQAGGNNQAVERNPSGAPVGSKTNPSPTVGAGGMQSGSPGNVRKQDESAGGNSGTVERNPDGSTGGSKSNPSQR
jgi:hypothetical protein